MSEVKDLYKVEFSDKSEMVKDWRMNKWPEW